MKTQQMSIVFVLIVGLLALVQTVEASQMTWNGNNASNVDSLNDSSGNAYLKNNTLSNTTGVIYASNYPNLQAAINAASTSKNVIITGIWSENSIQVPDNYIIHGEGATIYLPSTSQKNFIIGNGTSIDGITFIANQTGRNVEAIAIDSAYGKRNNIYQNSFYNYTYSSGTSSAIRGLYIDTNIYNNNFTVSNKDGSAYPLYLLSGGTNNNIFSNLFQGTFSGNFIYELSNGQLRIHDNKFVQTSGWTNGAIEAIDLEGGNGNIVYGNIFDSPSVDGILVGQNPAGGNVLDLSVYGNYFYRAGYIHSAKRGGISLSSFTGIVVEANIYGNTFNLSNQAVRVGEVGQNYAVNATISNNRILNAVDSFNTYGNNYTVNIYNNDLENITNPFYSGGAVPSLISYNNKGISPYYFGKKDTAPTAFGEGDTFNDLTNHAPRYNTGSIWDWLLMPSKVYGSANVTVTNNNNGSITISSIGGSGGSGTCPLCEPTITGSTSNVFWNGQKNWISLSSANISDIGNYLLTTNLNTSVNPQNVNASNLTSGTIPSARYGDNYRNRTISFIISNGSNVIGTGVKGDVEIPFSGTIIQATALADQAGSVNISWGRTTYGSYPGITPLGYIDTAGGISARATQLSQAVTAGDILRFNVTSAATSTRVSISLLAQIS